MKTYKINYGVDIVCKVRALDLRLVSIFQPNSITVPKGMHAITLQTARSVACL